jgi:hypothetical protein
MGHRERAAYFINKKKLKITCMTREREITKITWTLRVCLDCVKNSLKEE